MDPPDALSTKIGERILRDFGFPCRVLLRTVNEMARIVHDNPFLKRAGIDDSKLHMIL
jgi:uncharacterized protein (DUF1697 family)